MLKKVNNFILNLSIEDGTYLVHIIELKEDNTYKEVFLHYAGSIDTFKNMSDIHLNILLESLMNKPNNSTFRLNKEISYGIV